MRGSTRKRGKTWTAYWFVQKFDPKTGELERQQRSKGGFTRQKDAQAHLDEVVPAAKTGTAVEPSTVPLGVFLQAEWLPAIVSTVRPTTRVDTRASSGVTSRTGTSARSRSEGSAARISRPSIRSWNVTASRTPHAAASTP